jgi:hypothetical protein
MDIRYNINRIHSLLSNKFDNVEILEKSSLKFGKYFEISIKESKELKMIIPFKNIDNAINFDFFYFSNPLVESSDLINRKSDVESINIIVEDILSNNRFSEEYLKN